jgi:hypothetical protein
MSAGLVLESSLQAYFFDQLLEVNRRTSAPLPNETIFYSSLVMDKFGESQQFFELNDEGKVREKILGVKLLESTNLPKEKKKRVLQDIGDTALLLCGYFAESLNKKMVDTRYYQELGQIAYQRLDAFVPSFYEVPSFYRSLSRSFESISMLMGIVSKNLTNSHPSDQSLLFVSTRKVS